MTIERASEFYYGLTDEFIKVTGKVASSMAQDQSKLAKNYPLMENGKWANLFIKHEFVLCNCYFEYCY